MTSNQLPYAQATQVPLTSYQRATSAHTATTLNHCPHQPSHPYEQHDEHAASQLPPPRSNYTQADRPSQRDSTQPDYQIPDTPPQWVRYLKNELADMFATKINILTEQVFSNTAKIDLTLSTMTQNR